MADAINFVDANGLRFAFLEEGSGPLVLLLHGFPDTAHSWDDLRPRIAAKGYRAVSPFMRSYSPSGIPDRDTDQETLARDPLALIEALGAREAFVSSATTIAMPVVSIDGQAIGGGRPGPVVAALRRAFREHAQAS